MQDSWPQLKSDSISWRKTLKNSHNSQIQWPVVSTLCQETKVYLNQKRWIRGNNKIGPVLEVTACCLQGKYGVEIRIMSMNKDNSHSWVRISHGLIKLVTNLNNNEQQTSEVQFEDYALKSNARAFASRSKAWSKTTKTYFCQLIHKFYTYWGKNLDRYWTTRLFAHRLFSVEETDQSSSSWQSVSGRLWSDWILEIKRLSSKRILSALIIGLLKCGRVQWQEEEETRKYSVLYWCFRNNSLPPSSSRSFRDAILLILHHKTLSWFRTISASTLIKLDVRSIYILIINSGLMPGGQNSSERQTIFCQPVNPMDKEHKDPETIRLGSTASCTVHAYSLEETSKHGVLGRHQTCSKERIKVLSNSRSNAVILHNTLLVYGNWRNHTRKSLNHLDPPPKVSLRNDWMKELVSEVARQAEDNQPQPNPNPKYRNGGDLLWQNKRLVRVLTKSIHVSLLTARIPICLLNVWRKTKTQTNT